MSFYPPSQVEVLEAFREWLDAERRVHHAVVQEPDKTERERPEIHYVLAPDTTGCQQIAAEVSSIWRSARAGKEDWDWDKWTRQVTRVGR